jgi:hypothetical protein
MAVVLSEFLERSCRKSVNAVIDTHVGQEYAKPSTDDPHVKQAGIRKSP